MGIIGKRNFNYWRECRIIAAYQFLTELGPAHNTTHMKTNTHLRAVIPGVLAIAAFVLLLRAPVSADSLFGFLSVLTLLGIAALEYRVSWRRVFGR
jgi:hypothetical protein